MTWPPGPRKARTVDVDEGRRQVEAVLAQTPEEFQATADAAMALGSQITTEQAAELAKVGLEAAAAGRAMHEALAALPTMQDLTEIFEPMERPARSEPMEHDTDPTQ